MEEETRLMLRMLSAVRLYFEKARGEMGGEIGAQPRQAPVLGVLARGGEMSQAEVARALNVTAATVAVSAARLEKLGYVARRVNEGNRRANVIGLTEAGKAEARRLARFEPRGHTPGLYLPPEERPHREFPLTLDLRRGAWI